MFRRRYLVLSGAALFAGCQTKNTGASSPAATPTEPRTAATNATETETVTETATATETATETETETPELTGTDLAAAKIEEAEAAIARGYDRYLGQAEGAATSLLDVGPETPGFEVEPVTVPLETARTHLEAASEGANSRQEVQIGEHRDAADWLAGAARVQRALSRVTGTFRAAVAAADRGENHTTVSDRLANAIDRLPAVDSAMAARPPVAERYFRGIDAIDGTAAVRKDERFQRQQSGLLGLRRFVEAAMDVSAAISSAQSSINAENYERAEQEAQRAIDSIAELDADAAEIEPESLRAMTARFRDVLDRFRNRAVGIRETARAEQA